MKAINKLNSSQINELHSLYQNEWWTKGRTLKETEACVNGSQIIIGLIDENNSLQGFARVLTDFIFKAIIFDVIVSKPYRNKGLGNQLMDQILKHPNLQSVKHFELYCLPEMVQYYEKYNFSGDVGGIKLMRLVTR